MSPVCVGGGGSPVTLISRSQGTPLVPPGMQMSREARGDATPPKRKGGKVEEGDEEAKRAMVVSCGGEGHIHSQEALIRHYPFYLIQLQFSIKHENT